MVENLCKMIYKFVVISGEEESFIREFELDENNTLLEFHLVIQEELEYDNSQMATFFTTTDNWEKEEGFTLIDMGSNTTIMEDIIIDDVIINENQKLIYIFDLFNERALFIEFVGETDEIEGREYPICIQSHGLPPKQILFNGFTNSSFDGDVSFDGDDIDDSEFSGEEGDDLPEFENLEDFDDL